MEHEKSVLVNVPGDITISIVVREVSQEGQVRVSFQVIDPLGHIVVADDILSVINTNSPTQDLEVKVTTA